MLDVEALDRRITYAHFSDAFPEFAVISTPDWLVLLLAAAGGFDGLVARDRRQLDTPESVVTLSFCKRLSFVTWRIAIEDPLVEWGQLMAYMPLVGKWMDSRSAGIFYLPKPALDGGMVKKARARAGELASEEGVSYPELVAEAKGIMLPELERRGVGHLRSLIGES